MLESRPKGIAKVGGQYRGREPTARRQTDEALRPSAEGSFPLVTADQFGISWTGVYRLLTSGAVVDGVGVRQPNHAYIAFRKTSPTGAPPEHVQRQP